MQHYRKRGGGEWERYVKGTVASNYLHNSVYRGSTAVGTCTGKESAAAGCWSYAGAPATLGYDYTYWNKSC
ncbi:lactococcin 972 family bacteriocin [Streptomonospora algeriensis]|uniref:Lactococcin 972 family bacteriocin n=1 Tax=Streptomonospora algeriensis TaxID=995084 RepID=A0ABW3BA13_9ACTN